jgi:hypothetical protein
MAEPEPSASPSVPPAPPGPDDVVTIRIGGKAGDDHGKAVIQRGAGRDSHPQGSGRAGR